MISYRKHLLDVVIQIKPIYLLIKSGGGNRTYEARQPADARCQILRVTER